MTVDSAAWQSPLRGGIARFGVVSPTVVDAAPAASILESHSPTTTAVDDDEEVPQRPDAPMATWAVSTAPVGVLARSIDGRPFSVRIAGTDAHARRPLQAVLTRVPSGGSLSVAAPVGQSSSIISADGEDQDAVETALKINDVIPVGTRLVYRPDEGAHDPWLGDIVGEYGGGSVDEWASEGEPYDWFRYRVEAEGEGDVSTNEAVVALSVRPVMNAAHLNWPLKVGAAESIG